MTLRTLPVRTRSGNVFDEFDRLFNELATPRFNGGGSSQDAFPIDLYETDEALVLEMAVPGLTADDLDISVEGRNLSLQARLPDVSDDSRRYWLQGLPRGTVTRNLRLPGKVDVDNVEARVHNGLLHLRLPKLDEAKVKKIAIANG